MENPIECRNPISDRARGAPPWAICFPTLAGPGERKPGQALLVFQASTAEFSEVLGAGQEPPMMLRDISRRCRTEEGPQGLFSRSRAPFSSGWPRECLDGVEEELRAPDLVRPLRPALHHRVRSAWTGGPCHGSGRAKQQTRRYDQVPPAPRKHPAKCMRKREEHEAP